MNIEAISPTMGSSQLQLSKASDQVSEGRKQKTDLQSEQAVKKQVQPEELLQQIKSLTQDGLYSVRFENDERSAAGMVVKIVDRVTDEVIRQVPAEELLALHAVFDDLRGNIVNTEG